MTHTYDNRSRGLRLLAEAGEYYSAMERFRLDRDRNKRYNYGDQWSDRVTIDGRTLTEEQYIKEQGSIPLKNNLIRRLVRNVIGVYNSRANEPLCIARDPTESSGARTLTTLLHYNMQVNRMEALLTRAMEEFLISGMVIHRKSYGRRGNRTDCWTDNVQPNNFFIDNRMRDCRGWDCSCLGEIHDITPAELEREFARNDSDRRRLRDIYGNTGRPSDAHDFGTAVRSGSFLVPGTPGLCRVIEIWRREVSHSYLVHDKSRGTLTRHAVNPGGDTTPMESHDVWRYYYVTPAGDILAEGDSPYAHGSHPYVVKAYPMIDGEIHSFVSDVIDQQRYTNRLITLYDWIMRASAKGVLLVPEDSIPRGVSPQDFADSWSRYNGVIFYRPSSQGNIPQQVSVNSTNIGIKELLDVQLNFFQEISGVNSALQGKVSNVAISADLYGQQTQNATTSLLDILDTFTEFVRDSAWKDIRNIQQFYSGERIRAIAGDDSGLSCLHNLEFDLSITPSTTTPAHRQATNATLMEIWKSGQITLEQMLRAGSFPFADSLLSDLG